MDIIGILQSVQKTTFSNPENDKNAFTPAQHHDLDKFIKHIYLLTHSKKLYFKMNEPFVAKL